MPKDIYDAWDYTEKGQDLENTWNAEFNKYKNKFPPEADELQRRIATDLPKDWLEKSQALFEIM